MKNELNDSTKELIARYLAGECTAEQERELMAWRNQSGANESVFAEFQKTADITQKHYAAMNNKRPDINVEAEWNQFLRNISEKNEAPIRTLSSTNSFSLWMKVAASLLVLAVTGGLIYSILSTDDQTILSAASSTLKTKLPDGSVIVLNRNSELRYASNFGESNRTVELSGEAYFDVTPDREKPFIINAGNAQVEVVGTSFTVTAYDSLADINVVVETGKVKLSIPDLKKEVQLTPGEKGTLSSSGSLNSQHNDDVNYQSWNTMKLVFVDDTLPNVISQINRAYNTNIALSAGVSDTCALTVTFDRQTLDAVLKVLETTLNLTIVRNGNQIEITAAGC